MTSTKYLCLTLCLTLLSLTPSPAHGSGSFGASHGEIWFSLHHDNDRHKRFFSSADADHSYRRFRRHFRRHMAVAAPKLTRLLRKVRKGGFPLLKLDLAYPELKKLSELPMLRKKTFPVIVELRVDPAHQGYYEIRLALSKAPSRAALTALRKKLKVLLQATWKSLPEEPNKKLKPKVRQRPVAKVHLGFAAIYAGARFEVSPRVARYFDKQLRRLVKGARPILLRSLAKAKKTKAASELLPLSRSIKPSELHGGHFNPNGPIVDEDAKQQRLRPRFSNRNLLVSTLFVAPKGSKRGLEQARVISAAMLEPLRRRGQRIHEDRLAWALRGKADADTIFERIYRVRRKVALATLRALALDSKRSKAMRLRALSSLSQLSRDTLSKQTLAVMARYYRACDPKTACHTNALETILQVRKKALRRVLRTLPAKSALRSKLEARLR